MSDSFSTDLSKLGISSDPPVVSPPCAPMDQALQNPSTGGTSYVPPAGGDVNLTRTQAVIDRANMNATYSAPPPQQQSIPVHKDTFMNYFPFLSTLNIDEGSMKSIVLGIILLMIIQMPQFRNTLLGMAPLILKSNTTVANLTLSVSIVAFFVIGQKFIT